MKAYLFFLLNAKHNVMLQLYFRHNCHLNELWRMWIHGFLPLLSIATKLFASINIQLHFISPLVKIYVVCCGVLKREVLMQFQVSNPMIRVLVMGSLQWVVSESLTQIKSQHYCLILCWLQTKFACKLRCNRLIELVREKGKCFDFQNKRYIYKAGDHFSCTFCQ